MDSFGAESGDPIARARNYLREDQQVVAQRSELEGGRERLEKVLKTLADFNLKGA
jgi:hypothetical protein